MTRLRRYSSRGPSAHRRPFGLGLESLESRQLLANFTVLNTSDSGAGSLRQAMLDANSASGAIKIVFNIPGSGVHTIEPLSDLPAIITPMAIEGYTQPGSSANTLAIGDNAKITIELTGNGPGTTARNAFTVDAGGTTVRGLAINQFSGDAFAIAGAAEDQIAGDFIGTDPTGTIALGNATNGTQTIQVDASDVTIGGPAAADRTIVSASGFYGIVLSSGTSDQIQNSYVGTDKSGTVALGNYGQGIYDAGASSITIGGTTAAVRNVISGNRSNAIALTTTAGNVVEGNYIGTDSTGTVKLGNGSDGIVISVGGNTIGGSQAGAGNVISGNAGAGMLINYSSAASLGNVIQGNLIGTDKSGTLPIPNIGQGINIGNEGDGGFNNLIGGTTAAVRNVISGNKGGGIATGGSGTGNLIEGNYIGVDVSGNVALPNLAEGVNIGFNSVTVGGFETGSQNVISGNAADGILVFGDGSLIENNIVGLGADGSTPLGNGGNGVEVIGLVTIGGSFAGARNIISANKGDGIALGGGSTRRATIQDNYIGTDSTGKEDRGNKANGIYIGTADVTVATNVIAANGTKGNPYSTTGGITLGNIGNGEGSADNNTIQGNLIGTAADGVSPLGNVGGGIIFALGASNNEIEGNTIAYNNTSDSAVGGGVAFEYSGSAAVGDAIDGNSIFANTGLGIDLGDDGVTLNTPGGPHSGPNDLQNFPIITSVSGNGSATSILGTLNAAPGTAFTIEFFSSPTADPSGYGQGKSLLGRLPGVTTDAVGNASFSASIPMFLAPGQFVTATAIDPAGNTSEFSQIFKTSGTSPLVVTTTADSGLGSLRAAIIYANANPGDDTITFAIPGTGIQMIAPNSPLPTITVPVTIDGYTQPGAHSNTLAQGDSASILIDIDGYATDDGGRGPSTGDGLVLSGGNSTIRGLAIGGFSSGAAVHLLMPGGDTIAGDLLGIDPTGTTANPDQVGVQVETANNTIGGVAPADRDVISANTLAGVYLLGTDALGNTVAGDFVGTNLAGTASLSKPGGGDGVAIDFGALGNTVGGIAAGARNVLSGNGASGVRIDGGIFSDLATGNETIQGNFIGTDAAGTADIGNGADGVAISDAYDNTIGGTTPAAGNTIAFNVMNGVDVLSGPGNPILGNLIFGNHRLGIDLGGDGVTQNTPGGPRAGPNELQNFPVLSSVALTASSTVITGTLTAAKGTVFTVQFFGDDVADSSGHGQGKTYLGDLTNVVTNTDGFAGFTAQLATLIHPGEFVTATATDSTGNTSEFSQDLELLATNPLIVTTTADSGPGSLRAAIEAVDANSGTQTISFDIPGSGVHTILPLTQLPTITKPVTIDGDSQPGSVANTNGPGLGDNAKPLIELSGVDDPSGIGLHVTAGNSSIRGLVINGFELQAIVLETQGGNVVAGNFIGTNAAGTAALANGYQNTANGAITIYQSTDNTIGGTAAADRNIISSNNGQGLSIGSNANGNVVQGNFIGTDATGTVALTNASATVQSNGVLIANAGGNTIGGTTAAARNVISGNLRGIAFLTTTTGFATNWVEGNFIGTDLTGTAPLANQGEGIYISSGTSIALPSIAMVGGTGVGAGNTIAFNAGSGVSVISGIGSDVSGNAILGNSIFSNGGLGIDLNGDGVTPNTPGGPHTGPNNLQNFPVLTSVATTATDTVVTGTLNAAQGTVFTVQFFGNDVADSSGHGEGKTYLGELTNVVTNTDGVASFTVDLAMLIQPGKFVTATATDPGGNTSEFAQDIQLPATATANLKLSISPATPNSVLTNNDYNYTVTVTNVGPQDASNVVVSDALGAGSTLHTIATAGAITNLSPTLTNVTFAKLASGASVTVGLFVRAAEAGIYNDTASVTANEADPDETNNSASVTETVVAPSADLRLTMSPVTPNPVLTNQDYNYSVTVTNVGPQDASNVVVSDALGAGSTLHTIATAGAITNLSPTLTNVTFASLASGASVTVGLFVRAAKAGIYIDTASVTANEADPNEVNNTAFVTETVAGPSADLRLTMSPVTPNPVLTNNDYSYSVKITNIGPLAASNVVLSDALGAGSTLHTIATAGAITNLSPTLTNVTFASLAAGASVTATYEVRASNAGTYTDTAAVAADQADPDKTNNTATVTETVVSPQPPTADLSVVGTVMPDIAIVGKPLTYTFTVTNKGPNAATDVKLSDTIPAGVRFVSVKSSLGTDDFVGGLVTSSIGSLGAGATATVTIVVTPSVMGTITDTASVGADQADPHSADNQVTVLVATTLDMPINVFSSLVKTTKGPYQVLVTWGYANSAQSGIRFNVYRVDASGSEIKVSGPAGTSAHDFVDTGAAANKTYEYRVTAFVGSGESARSDETTMVVTLSSSARPGAASSRTRSRQASGAVARSESNKAKAGKPSTVHRHRPSVHVKPSSQAHPRPSTFHKPTHLS